MFQKLQKILGNSVKENEPLKNHTTFKIGGPARYFFIAESEEDVVKAVRAANELGLDYFVLGGGSNILVSDEGFKGFVIKIQSLMRGGLRRYFHTSKYGSIVSNLEIRGDFRGNFIGVVVRGNFIEAAAGVLLQVLVQEAARAGLSGLENAVGIPGTLGGALYGNAGNREQSIGDVVKSVKILLPNGVIEEKNKDWMEFRYRESKIKKMKPSERPIILSAVLELKPGNPSEIKKTVIEKIAGREQKFPKEPSAGCVFKNPEGMSAGQLIDSLGFKGKCVGDACVSNLHANFIINKGNATAKDVKELIDLIKETIKEKKGIELEEEIQCLGF